MEADTIKQVEMKDKIQKEYLRWTRKLLETKLSSRNLIKGISTWAVSLVRYSEPFLKWSRDELKQMDQRTRKLMTMHKALHPRDDVDSLYASRKWEGKQLYGRFKRLINNISHDKTWTWLRKGNFKRETESLLIAAQNNAVITNHIKARIDKTQQNSKCWLCGDRDETINHIISECSKLAQKEYKTRHDWVSKGIHWEMCKKFKVDHTNKWYMDNPASVLWDFNIQTDHRISARRPHLIIINKKRREIAKLWTLLSRLTTE